MIGKCDCTKNHCPECGNCECGSTSWISVKDGLPEESLYVLMYLNDGRRNGLNIGYYLDEKWWGYIKFNGDEVVTSIVYEDFIMDGIPTRFVTHWMPLPEAPKEERGEFEKWDGIEDPINYEGRKYRWEKLKAFKEKKGENT